MNILSYDVVTPSILSKPVPLLLSHVEA